MNELPAKQRFLYGASALAIGSVLTAWIVLLASVGLVGPMLLPLGIWFLICFLAGFFLLPHFRWLHIPCALPMTVACPPLALRVIGVYGIFPALFWVVVAILVWLACRFGIHLGAKQREKYAHVFFNQ